MSQRAVESTGQLVDMNGHSQNYVWYKIANDIVHIPANQSYIAASLWNNLAAIIKTCDTVNSFKRLLKTISFLLHINEIRQEHLFFTKLFVTVINTYTYLLVLLLHNNNNYLYIFNIY